MTSRVCLSDSRHLIPGSHFFDEPEAALYTQIIHDAEHCLISTANFLELYIVVEPFTVERAHLSRRAFHDFGKGGHAAALNFGDCFTYALAKQTGESLLFKGNDFKNTDIVSVL